MGVTEDGKRALERLKVRREMRSMNEEEDSQVIEREALSRRPQSVPAPARGIVAILDKLPPWGRVIVLVVLIGAAVASGIGAKLAGWF